MRKRDRIRAVLSADPDRQWFVLDLCRASGVRFVGGVYPTLERLEAEGLVESGWADGPRPRRRWYRWVSS